MSRSYKKHCGGKITTARSDKADKRLWHRSVRAMKREWLGLAGRFSDADDMPIVPRDVDSTLADTWSWDSDGGSYLMETDTSVRAMLEQTLRNMEAAVADYKRCKRHYDWEMTSIIARFIRIQSSVQVREFLSKKTNAEKVMRLWKRLNFGK